MSDTIEQAAQVLRPADQILVFSGAGLSTESGLPDFRGPDGLWTKVDPDDFTIERWVARPDIRARGWKMHVDGELWPQISNLEDERSFFEPRQHHCSAHLKNGRRRAPNQVHVPDAQAGDKRRQRKAQEAQHAKKDPPVAVLVNPSAIDVDPVHFFAYPPSALSWVQHFSGEVVHRAGDSRDSMPLTHQMPSKLEVAGTTGLFIGNEALVDEKNVHSRRG